MNEIKLENEIMVLTTKTVTLLLAENPDSLVLYMFYYKNAKIQKTNQVWATDTFCMKGLGWSNRRLKKAKDILTQYDQVEFIKHRDKGKFVGFYVRLKYIWSKQNEPVVSKPVVSKSTSGKKQTNALSKEKEMLKVNKLNSNEVASVIKLFEKLDPKNKTYYNHKTQRAKAEFLLEEYGYEKIEGLIDVYLKFKGEQFLPSISSPFDMVEKWTKLEDFFRRKQAENNTLANKWIM